MMAFSLLATGSLAQGRRHYDHAIALYDPAVHRPLAMLFGHDLRVVGLALRSLALWFLGYPEAALADTNQSLKEAREMGQAGTMFLTLNYAIIAHFLCGNYATTETLANELSTLADEQDAVIWKLAGLSYRGWIFAVTGRASEAVQSITPPLAAYRSTGSTYGTPLDYHCWRNLTRTLASLMTLGAQLMKRKRLSREQGKGGSRPMFIVLQAK